MSLGAGWGRRAGSGAAQGRAYPVAFALRAVILGLGRLFCQLLLPLRASPEEDVVDQGVLQQGQEHEHEAAHEVHVDGFDVGDLGQRLPQVRVDGGHGQDGGDAYERGGMSGRGLPVPSPAFLSVLSRTPRLGRKLRPDRCGAIGMQRST